MVEETKKEEKIIKLDLACGQNKREGFTGVDIAGNPDIIHDLNVYPYPFDDNSVDEIYCSHYVEHIPHDNLSTIINTVLAKSNNFEEFKINLLQTAFGCPIDGLHKFMDECYRILKPGARMTIDTPYYSSVRACQDPSHIRSISELTFYYYDKNWREMQKLDHYFVKSNFEVETISYSPDPLIATKAEEAKVFMIKHYINTILDIRFILKKRR